MKFFILLAALFLSLSVTADELAYVKTDSPRDTMETFYKAMNDYREGVETHNYKKRLRIQDAIRTFYEKDSAVITSQREKELAAILLKEVIDRVIVLDLEKIPNEKTGTRWRLKNTEIVIKPVTGGEREGEWLFTESTWRRAGNFYQRVKELPYQKGSGMGAMYEQPWMDEYLPEWTRQETLKLKNWQWLGLLIGFFFGLLARGLVHLVIIFYRSLNNRLRGEWQSEFIDQIEKPAGLLVAAFFWYLWIYYLRLEGLAFSMVNGIIQVVFGVAFTWAAYAALTVLAGTMREKAAKTESTLDDQLIPFIERALKMTVILLGLLIVLQNMGVNVGSLLAGLGLGGLAFALAAQDTAANLFGSIMILIDQPFKVGDWVIVGEVEGTVEEVGFRSTRIRTFYNSLITVPNAEMANAKIDNMGERHYRRVRTFLDIAYDTPPEKIDQFIDGIRKIITENSFTRKDYYHVYFNAYGESSLKIMLYFFFITNDWAVELRERQNVFMEVFELADKLGVEFAYPTRTLYLKNEGELPQ